MFDKDIVLHPVAFNRFLRGSEYCILTFRPKLLTDHNNGLTTIKLKVGIII